MTSALVQKLEAWREHDFHGDRQLADECLIADGWSVERDEDFEGGIRWFHGVNPQVSSAEKHRPHPIHDLNAAVALIPYKMDWTIGRITGGPLSNKPGPRYVAEISDYDGRIPDVAGESSELTVAVCIAAIKAITALKEAA